MISLIKFAEKFFENPDNIIIFSVLFCFVYAFFLYLFNRPPGELRILNLKRFKSLSFYRSFFGPK
jgi:hypothetical protein